MSVCGVIFNDVFFVSKRGVPCTYFTRVGDQHIPRIFVEIAPTPQKYINLAIHIHFFSVYGSLSRGPS